METILSSKTAKCPQTASSVALDRFIPPSLTLDQLRTRILALPKHVINRTDLFGRTLLHLACTLGDGDLVDILLEHPFLDRFAADGENGWTALHRALYFGNIDCASRLLSSPYTASAKNMINVKDRNRETAFQVFDDVIRDTQKFEQQQKQQQLGDVHSFDAGSELFTFGSNANHTLGFADSDNRSNPERVKLSKSSNNQTYRSPNAKPLSPRDSFAGVNILDIKISPRHTVVLTGAASNNLLVCGIASAGRLGLENTNTNSFTTSSSTTHQFQLRTLDARLLAHERIRAVALGCDHTIAISDRGAVYTWGSNKLGQLGYLVGSDGEKDETAVTTTDNNNNKNHTVGTSSGNDADEEYIQPTPKRVQGGELRKFKLIGCAASNHHSVAFTRNEMFMWGKNVGQMGFSSLADGVNVIALNDNNSNNNNAMLQIVPQKVPFVSLDISMVCATDFATMVLFDNHDLIVFMNGGHFKINLPLSSLFNNSNNNNNNGQFDVFTPKHKFNVNFIAKIAASNTGNLAMLTRAGEIFTVNLLQFYLDQTKPNQIVKTLKPKLVWVPRVEYLRARDVDIGDDGSIILCTQSGASWRFVSSVNKRNNRVLFQNNTNNNNSNSSSTSSNTNNSAINDQDNNYVYSDKSFKFQRIARVNKIAMVRCDPLFVSFGIVRNESPIEQIPVRHSGFNRSFHQLVPFVRAAVADTAHTQAPTRTNDCEPHLAFEYIDSANISDYDDYDDSDDSDDDFGPYLTSPFVGSGRSQTDIHSSDDEEDEGHQRRRRRKKSKSKSKSQKNKSPILNNSRSPFVHTLDSLVSCTTTESSRAYLESRGLTDHTSWSGPTLANTYDMVVRSKQCADIAIPVHRSILSSRCMALKQLILGEKSELHKADNEIGDRFGIRSDIGKIIVRSIKSDNVTHDNNPIRCILEFDGINLHTLVIFIYFLYTDQLLEIWGGATTQRNVSKLFLESKEELVKLSTIFDMNEFKDLIIYHRSLRNNDNNDKLEHYCLSNNLAALINDSTFSNVLVKLANGREFFCHAEILSTRSSFFNAILSNRWGDSLPAHSRDGVTVLREIDLSHIEYDHFEILMNHIYANKCGSLFDNRLAVASSPKAFISLVLKILEISDELLMLRLKDYCEVILTNFLTVKTCAWLLNESSYYYAKKLKHVVLQYICDNMSCLLENGFINEGNLSPGLYRDIEDAVKLRQLISRKSNDGKQWEHHHTGRDIISAEIPGVGNIFHRYLYEPELHDDLVTNTTVSMSQIYASDFITTPASIATTTTSKAGIKSTPTLVSTSTVPSSFYSSVVSSSLESSTPSSSYNDVFGIADMDDQGSGWSQVAKNRKSSRSDSIPGGGTEPIKMSSHTLPSSINSRNGSVVSLPASTSGSLKKDTAFPILGTSPADKKTDITNGTNSSSSKLSSPSLFPSLTGAQQQQQQSFTKPTRPVAIKIGRPSGTTTTIGTMDPLGSSKVSTSASSVGAAAILSSPLSSPLPISSMPIMVPAPSASALGVPVKMSQKEKKRLQKEKQMSNLESLDTEPKSSSVEENVPWKIKPKAMTPAIPVVGAPGAAPVIPTIITKANNPATANSKATKSSFPSFTPIPAGPSKSGKKPAFFPASSLTSASVSAGPAAASSSPLSLSTSSLTSSSAVNFSSSLADIIAEQEHQRQKKMSRKKTLKEIQEEEEFNKWWELESKKLQEQAAREEALLETLRREQQAELDRRNKLNSQATKKKSKPKQKGAKENEKDKLKSKSKSVPVMAVVPAVPAVVNNNPANQGPIFFAPNSTSDSLHKPILKPRKSCAIKITKPVMMSKSDQGKNMKQSNVEASSQ